MRLRGAVSAYACVMCVHVPMCAHVCACGSRAHVCDMCETDLPVCVCVWGEVWLLQDPPPVTAAAVPIPGGVGSSAHLWHWPLDSPPEDARPGSRLELQDHLKQLLCFTPRPLTPAFCSCTFPDRPLRGGLPRGPGDGPWGQHGGDAVPAVLSGRWSGSCHVWGTP